MSFYRTLAILLGIGASLLVIASIAVFYGYLPTSLVDNLTSPELGVLGVMFIAGAAGSYVMGERRA